MVDNRDVDAEVAQSFDPSIEHGVDKIALHNPRDVGRADPPLRDGRRRDAQQRGEHDDGRTQECRGFEGSESDCCSEELDALVEHALRAGSR